PDWEGDALRLTLRLARSSHHGELPYAQKGMAGATAIAPRLLVCTISGQEKTPEPVGAGTGVATTARRLARVRPSNATLREPPQPEKAVPVNVLSREEAVRALHLLVEGNSLRSVTRLTGTHRSTAIR